MRSLILTLLFFSSVFGEYIPKLPPFSLVVNDKTGIAEAIGTLRFDESEGTAYPYHTIRLVCVKDVGLCYESKAILENGELSNWLWFYRIGVWDEKRIYATTDDATCVDEGWAISRDKRVVLYVKMPKQDKIALDNPICKAFTKRLGAQLIDGAKAIKLEAASKRKK
jgi:hypothetical protein